MTGRKPLNTPHVVTVGAPLLRPGLTISATCSEKYVAEVASRLLNIAREVNADPAQDKSGLTMSAEMRRHLLQK